MLTWLGTFLAEVVAKSVGEVLRWFSAYRQGRLAERVKHYESTHNTERGAQQAVETIRHDAPIRVTDEWLQHPPRTPATGEFATPPPAPTPPTR